MKKPNILFILTDDQRHDTIGAMGNHQIKTPNLDKLAENGTSFSQAHIPGGSIGAVCMPSRAMIHSGKTLFQLSQLGSEIPKSHTTMGQCFRENGYDTIGIGKWHNGTESYSRSFSEGDNIFFGGMWDHWNVPVYSYQKDGVYDKKSKFTPDFFNANFPMEMLCEKISVGVHSTDLFTKSAIDFLDKKRDNPFLLYISYLAPHDPRTMPEEFQNMYNSKDILLPENFLPEHPFNFGIGEARGESRDEDLASYPRGEDEIKQHIADYYAMISHIDHNVGKIIEKLEETGQLDNTIIVFTGDNGLAVGQHGLMGKQNLYEHSIRVPLIMSGVGIEKGNISDNYVYLLDIFPTLCDLAGVNTPQSVEGKSFCPMLCGDSTKTREDLYLCYTSYARGVKDDRFKLIEYRKEREKSQLFDLINDPLEKENLFAKPEYSKQVKKLRQLMLDYKAEWEDGATNDITPLFWDNVKF